MLGQWAGQLGQYCVSSLKMVTHYSANTYLEWREQPEQIKQLRKKKKTDVHP